MWILFQRAPVPDAADWPGRRGLAAIDALAWPVALAVLLSRVPATTGVFVPTAMAILVLAGMVRVHRAVWRNHRYRFTTWRVARVLAVLMVVGLALKIGLA